MTRDVNVEAGNLYNSFWKKRFWPPSDVVWHEMVYESTSDAVTIQIEENGFYSFHFRIRKFMGNVDFAWEKNLD